VQLNIDKKALQYINDLPAKDRRIVKTHLLLLEDPRTAPDVELLENGHCRMHISHSYTVFFDVLPGGIVNILEVMTIEEAHTRYKRFR
jgi:mRNA-degrading endonuclease RelE of RelBE toxin-antitoxin system